MASKNVELSNAIDAAMAALDDVDFESYPSHSVSAGDDWEGQLQMKVQVFYPPPLEEEAEEEDNSSEGSTAASQSEYQHESQSKGKSMAAEWKSKAAALASSAMPRAMGA